MRFNFYSDCINQSDDSFSYTDFFNIVIAGINLCLVIYIFRHQRKKEKDEREFQINSKSKEFKHNWFKEILIIPKIEKINIHFNSIERISGKLKEDSLTTTEKKAVEKKLKVEFRKFSKDFIELLYAVDLEFATQVQDISDKCFDKLQKEAITPSSPLNVDSNYNSFILEEISTYRNNLFSKIYNFDDFN